MSETPPYLLLAHFCHNTPDRGQFDAAIILGQWGVILAMHSHADLRPIRRRAEAKQRRAG